ncbi:MAG: hypothetical protein MZV64_01860 [Ignavibacteriales bacterium]|nr:hypothetical protein [Ignavibacteriales bacterium]
MRGAIYKTTDGGITWQNSCLNQYTPGVFSLSFSNEDAGFGVGIHGVIMRTTNGGTGWSVLTQGFNNPCFILSALFLKTWPGQVGSMRVLFYTQLMEITGLVK